MKRPKKSTPKFKIVETKIWSVVCPHCHTELVGGFGASCLMLKCYNCSNPIDLREKENK